mgnify:FL=1
MNNCSVILGILQENRVETATKVQDILTKYGCHIRVRLGLHDSGVDYCANSGLILLQLCGDNLPLEEFKAELTAVPNVKVQSMSF